MLSQVNTYKKIMSDTEVQQNLAGLWLEWSDNGFKPDIKMLRSIDDVLKEKGYVTRLIHPNGFLQFIKIKIKCRLNTFIEIVIWCSGEDIQLDFKRITDGVLM